MQVLHLIQHQGITFENIKCPYTQLELFLGKIIFKTIIRTMRYVNDLMYMYIGLVQSLE